MVVVFYYGVRMISIRSLRQQLRYDPVTGLLRWCLPKQGRRLERPAGRLSKERHVTVGIDYKQYPAHVLIWAIQTGRWPKKEVDHKNRKRADNRWVNLREATTQQNRWNASLRSDNSSGIKGVSFMPRHKKWRARAYVNRKEKHLGLFSSKQKARAAYIAVAVSTRGEYAHV
jgi:hypothetical protein